MYIGEVAPHLFVVCNYNTDIFPIISEDAKFLQAVLNLYKFAIDASLINKINGIDKELGDKIFRNHRDWRNELVNCLGIISNLRTYTSHNNYQNDIIEYTEKWMIKTLKKKRFETLDDYTKGINELEKIGSNLYQTVTKIISFIAKEYPKKNVQQVWEKYILSFYSNSNIFKLIKEELRLAYLAQSKHGRDDVDDIQLGQWCYEMYVGDSENKVKMLSSYLSRSQGKQKEKLLAEIERLNKEIDNTKGKIANEFNITVYRLQFRHYLEYYCKSFNNKCKSYLSEIIDNDLTMLPQDMFQYIISLDFCL